jgi:hypothetical protein
MELVSKLEKKLLDLFKNVPHLPANARTWLGDNVWWIVVIGAISSGIGVLVFLSSLFGSISLLSGSFVSYYVSTTFVGLLILNAAVALFFIALECLLLALAVMPLKEKQKKGWVLLFTAWLVGIVYAVVAAILTFNVFSVIGNLIFGAIWVAVSGYFLFEIHSHYAHVERSKGVKEKKA